MRRLLLAGLLSTVCYLLTTDSLAQPQSFNLVTSPLPINLTTTPGKPVSTELRVKNNSPQPERLQVTLYKFSVNEASEVSLSEGQPGDDFMEWVSFAPTVFTAEPNQWKTVKMNINVPAEAALGYYYAVGFSRAEAPTPVPSGAALRGQVITFVLLDVQVPGAKRELTVTEFSSDRGVYEFLPAAFTVKVKNTGNIHTVPTGTIFIKRGSKTVGTLAVNPGQGNILPGSTRTFTAQWEDGFPLHVPKETGGQPVSNPDSTTATTLKWDFGNASKLRIGKYQAQLILVYDDGQRDVPIEGSVGFWVVPFRLILAVILIPLVPALLVYILMKRRFRKRLARETKK